MRGWVGAVLRAFARRQSSGSHWWRSAATVFVGMLAGLGCAAGAGVALADGGTQVTGSSDSSQPLTISPSTDPVVSSNVNLANGTRVFFIASMPKTMTLRWVTIGDLARDQSCTESPSVDLLVYDFPAGSDLESGSLAVQSTAPQVLGSDLGRARWLVDPITLTQGDAYAFVIRADQTSSCGLAQERSWAHNTSVVDGDSAVCASLQDGSGRMRFWHEQNANDVGDCSTSVLNFDPSMPSGWGELDTVAGGAALNTSSGSCATDLGAVETTWQGSSVLCQFPQFAAPGSSAGPDGWYYGLPWNGPGLDGSPRDLYVALKPDIAPHGHHRKRYGRDFRQRHPRRERQSGRQPDHVPLRVGN